MPFLCILSLGRKYFFIKICWKLIPGLCYQLWLLFLQFWCVCSYKCQQNGSNSKMMSPATTIETSQLATTVGYSDGQFDSIFYVKTKMCKINVAYQIFTATLPKCILSQVGKIYLWWSTQNMGLGEIRKKNFGLSLGSTEELLSDAEYVAIALGLFWSPCPCLPH